MQDERSKIVTGQQQPTSNELDQPHDAFPVQSSSMSNVNGILDIEIQASQLFDYIDKLNTFADRAYHNAINNQSKRERRLEEVFQSDLANLNKLLEQTKAALQERNVAYAVLQEKTKAQLTEMEKRLLEKQVQLLHREEEIKTLTTDITSFIKHQQQPQESEQPTLKSHGHQLNSELHAEEIERLKLQLAKRDEIIQAKNDESRVVQSEFRLKIQELENALRANTNRLEQHEALLKQKEALIQATAIKEAEIGKLINCLSTECDNLNKQLQEKTRRLAQLEKEKAQSSNDVRAWRQVAGQLQEDPT